MAAAELSDGTLRFFCLAAALLTPKPPPLLVLNEPEASLHSGLIQPLADLIGHASKTTQLLVVTHSHDLAAAIRTTGEAVSVELVSTKERPDRKVLKERDGRGVSIDAGWKT